MKLLCNINGKVYKYNIISRSRDCENFKVATKDNYLGYGYIIDNLEQGYYHFWFRDTFYKGI